MDFMYRVYLLDPLGFMNFPLFCLVILKNVLLISMQQSFHPLLSLIWGGEHDMVTFFCVQIDLNGVGLALLFLVAFVRSPVFITSYLIDHMSTFQN